MATTTYVPRLKSKYKDEIRTALKEKFQYKSVMQVPKLEKIAINQGVGGATTDKKLIENTINELSTITGQQAVSSKSKKRSCDPFLVYLLHKPDNHNRHH